MSRIFEALQQAKAEISSEPVPFPPARENSELVRDSKGVHGLDHVPSFPIKTLPEYRLVAVTDENSLGAEKIRVLSTRLRNLQQRRNLKKVLITSSMSEEGKSVVSANLALTLAMRGRKKTLLIGGDLRQPTTASLFGISQAPGLTDWWRGRDSLCAYLRRVEDLPLWLLPAGSRVEQPLEVLQSERFAKLLAEVSDWFDWLIVDSPPLNPMADSGVWMNLVDGVLIIARVGRTPKKLLRKTVETIEQPKFVGIVLNEARESVQQHYYYYQKNYRSAPQGIDIASQAGRPNLPN